MLSVLDGTASVSRGTAAFAPAADGDIVAPGDGVQTAALSHALVAFFDGSTLEIEPATTVQIEEAQAVNGGAIAIRISQTLGRTWASVQKLTRADSKFELRTPTLTAAVRGTGFITEVLADGASTVRSDRWHRASDRAGSERDRRALARHRAQPNVPPTRAGADRRCRRTGCASGCILLRISLSWTRSGARAGSCSRTDRRASDPGLPRERSRHRAAARRRAGCASGRVPDLRRVDRAGGAFVATASALDGVGDLSFNFTVSGSGEPGATHGSTST